MTSTVTNQNISLAQLDDYINAAMNAFAGTKESKISSLTTKPNFNAGSETFVRQLCLQAREVFMSQSSLIEVEAPIKICGDIHGQFSDLIRIFQTCGIPPHSNYLFLGDYVDRGRYGVETICLLLALKIRYPENFFLLRGNHECAAITRQYGFFDECKRKFNKITVWKCFCDVFNCLPVAAVVEEKIFCCHGGLSPEAMTPKELGRLKNLIRPCEIPDSGVVCDLMWSDPDSSVYGWAENEDRGVSFLFGNDIIEKFLKNNDFDLICRAHQVVQDGYQFHAQRRLVTIFSAANYTGTFENSGAVMSINHELMCSFTVLKPKFTI